MKLSKENKEKIIRLRKEENLQYQKIATRFGISVSRVKSICQDLVKKENWHRRGN